ncbi:MAG TPA: CRISPR-associated protein Cas4 [Syntrophomonas sp.]|nr:CRISPR-associated protein Cas4 [Syntrophomonas sp.]
MEYDEEAYLLLSGIQHFAFCRRQWALIHIEQVWQENVRTIEGKFLHEKAHDYSIKEKRGDLIISRGMSVFSKTLGITGTCDVVEFHKDPAGVPIVGREGLYLPVPVEYKRGKPKENDEDILQLIAQAICLEDMMACEVKTGYLFYGETNHRTKVEISSEYRQRVQEICSEMHKLYQRRYTPKVKTGKQCKACSLADLCWPKLCGKLSAAQYIERSLSE